MEEAPYDIEKAYEQFLVIHDDNWEELGNVGIPLYTSLKETNDPRAEEVRGALTYLAMTMESSGAGDEDIKKARVERINQAIK